MKNYYEILDIEFNSSQDQIRKAYRINAIKYHPDKHFGDQEFNLKFIEIKEAYDMLSNTTYRQEYDLKYQQVFGRGETLNREDEHKKERTYKKQREEERFRHDPYKPFYSFYDRESQETPQFEPEKTPWGEKINGAYIFFTLPERIGKIVGGFSTLFKGQKRHSFIKVLWTAIKSSYYSLPIFALIGLIFLIFTPNPDGQLFRSTMIFLCTAIPWIAFKVYYLSNHFRFEHSNFFIGINGFAYYKCKGSKDNIIKSYEINFNDVTDVISKFVINKLNFRYQSTTYKFLWMNTKTHKFIYQNNGSYSDEKDNPNKYAYPEYWLNKEAEKYWTVYLLDNMEKILEQQGYILFNLYSFEQNTFHEYIKLGVGYVTFLKDQESFTYNFNEIKRIYTKGADLFIEHKNFEKKLFFFKSGNQDKIPLQLLCNRQFFYKTIEILLGYKI